MTNNFISPTRLTAMTEADLAALTAEQLQEIDSNLEQTVEWVKKTKAKTYNAMERRYAKKERAARSKAEKDFGTVHFQDGPIRVTVERRKRVSWDQNQLAKMARRITARGERVEDYLDVEYSIPETRFTSWPRELREQFGPARIVNPGKATCTLTPIFKDRT
jgi:hypothetical protein